MVRLKAFGVLAAVAALTAALGTPAASASIDRGNDVAIGFDSADSVVAPTSMHPGIAHFVVSGTEASFLQLAKPKHGGTVATLLADLNALSSDGNAIALDRDFTLVGGGAAGHDLYLTITPGRYYAIDSNNQAPTATSVATIVAAGSLGVARYPRLTGEVNAVRQMSWGDYPRRIGSRGYLRFDNFSSESHFLELAQLKDGVTLDQVKAVLNDPNADPSTIATGVSFETGVISSGRRMTIAYDLPKGSYAMLCFWPDPETGMPHSLMGMVRLITVG